MIIKPKLQRLLDRYRRTRSERHFSPLYDLCTPKVYGMALRLTCGCRVEAEDLVQETWSRALLRLDDYRGDAQFTSWLISILINCNRERRSRGSRLHDVEESFDGIEEGQTDLMRVLSSLPTGYLEVLLLHDLAGFTHLEIARHFGIAEGTSRSQLSRARSVVRRRLGT